MSVIKLSLWLTCSTCNNPGEKRKKRTKKFNVCQLHNNVSWVRPIRSTSCFVTITINPILPSAMIYSPHVFRLIPCHIHFSSLPFVLESHTSLVKIRTTLWSIHFILMLSFHLPLGLQSSLKETGHLENTNKYYLSVNNTTFILYTMIYIYMCQADMFRPSRSSSGPPRNYWLGRNMSPWHIYHCI